MVAEIAGWNSAEIKAFFETFLLHGSNWVAIAAAVRSKSVEQVALSIPARCPPSRLSSSSLACFICLTAFFQLVEFIFILFPLSVLIRLYRFSGFINS